MGGELIRPMGETMKTKLIVTMGAVGLAAWMGASFVAPAEVTEMAEWPLIVQGPETPDSHRLGMVEKMDVELPGAIVEVDGPNLFCLLTKED